MLEKFKAMTPSVPVRAFVDGGLKQRNVDYLASMGVVKTPRVLPREIELRGEIEGVDWSDIAARHAALKGKGFDIFDIKRGKESGGAEEAGETFSGSIDLDNVTV